MEQFGIWNLLKSVLSSGAEQPNSGDFRPASTPPQPAKTPAQPAPPREKENACGQYLLRHETLRQKRK